MKNKITVLIASISLVAAFAGCMTTKTTTVTPNSSGGFDTNVVTTVNSNNLILDSAAVQVATAVAVTATLNATHNDPSVVGALKNAQIAIGGILNGTNPQTTQTVIELLKAQGNPALAQQVAALVQSISAAEQTLLAKYGSSVAGQITVAMTQAVYSGLTVGLTGH